MFIHVNHKQNEADKHNCLQAVISIKSALWHYNYMHGSSINQCLKEITQMVTLARLYLGGTANSTGEFQSEEQ